VQIFTLERSQVLLCQRNTKAREEGVTVGRKAKSGGSDPAFLRQAAQKFSGVAPALDAIGVGLFSHGEESQQTKFHARFIKTRVQKRRERMPILKSPLKPPKNETLQIRVEEQVRSKLTKYAEFIDSSESYVVSEALRLVFKKDNDFRSWLKDSNRNGDQPQNGGSLFEITKKA
jgi:predicted transcriptional regulator